MGIVCQTCGDEGFTQLLYCCSNCNVTAEHLYCLPRIPIDDEDFTYICEQCVSKQNNVGPEQEELITDDPTSAVEGLEENETSFLTEVVAVEAKELDHALCLHDSVPEERELITNDPTSAVEAVSAVEALEREETSFLVEVVVQAKDSIPECFVNDGILNRKRRRLAREDPGLDTVPILQVDSFSFPKPEGTISQAIINPAWKGCFEVYQEKFGRFVAHLSNKAGFKVIEAVKLMPVVLSVKMMSRVEAWPKSFSASAPSDGNIALYFFPGNESAVKSFDELVNQTVKQDLVLKALIHNVELLIFSSKQLPMPYWTYKGKYYFWGVFRGREESSNAGVGINKNIAEVSLTSHLGTSIGFSSDSRSSPKLPQGPEKCL